MSRYKDLDMVFGPDGVPHVNTLVSNVMNGNRVSDTEFLDLETYPFVTEVTLNPRKVPVLRDHPEGM